MPTETVVVMFTDLVGSTELLTRVGGDEAESLRQEQFAVLRAAIEAHGGREVKNLGDGLMGAFAVPTAALDAAVEMQQRLELRNRRATEALEIRVGLSIGEADVEDRDYFGTPVVEAARLCGIAAGGQILVSQALKLLAGSRGRHEFAPLGERQLKGLAEETHVAAVIWAPLTGADAAGVPLPASLERAAEAVFVGRAVERAALFDALKDAHASSQTRVVLLSGEAGIGKTTLVGQVAAGAHAQGTPVVYGRCEEDLPIPYQPWREAFTQLAQLAPEVIASHRHELAPLFGISSDSGGHDAESRRFALYGAVVAALNEIADDVPLLITLDDLHWAEAQTVELLRHVALSIDGARLCILGTFREADIDASHPMTGALAAFHRDAKVSRLPLRGFDDLEVLALLEALAGHEMDEDGLMLRDALCTETAGNPFFATEILRHLSETGAIAQRDGRWRATTDLEAHGLPVSVREVISHRVSRLGAETRHALSNAAVIGREFDLSLLAELAGFDAEAMLEALTQAVDAALLQEIAPERFTFAHALVGHALYDDIGATRRARLHRTYAEVLERHSASEAASVAELAHHWSLATTVQDAHKAAEYARLTGDDALAQLAPIEAAHWYSRALELTDAGDDLAQCKLRVDLGEAQRQAGDPAYRETLLDASERAIALGAEDLLVQAALANNRGTWSTPGAIDEERVRILKKAVGYRTNGLEGAVLRAMLAVELIAEDLRDSRIYADEAISLARATRDDGTFARVVRIAEVALRDPECLALRRALVEEAEAAALRTNDPTQLPRIATSGQMAALESADRAEYERYFAVGTAYADQSPEPYTRYSVAFLGSLRHLLNGQISEAEATCDAAFELGMATGQAEAVTYYAGQLFEIRRAQGRLAEVLPVFERAASENPGLPVLRSALALALCDVGREAAARQLAHADFTDKFAAFRRDFTWATSMCCWAEVCRRLDAVEPAGSLVELLTPWRDHVATTGITCAGSVSYGLALALATTGQIEQAIGAFQQARDVNSGLGAPILVARTEADFAWALREVDQGRARALATSAAMTAGELGLATIARRANELLEALA